MIVYKNTNRPLRCTDMGGLVITRNTPLGGFALLLHPKEKPRSEKRAGGRRFGVHLRWERKDQYSLPNLNVVVIWVWWSLGYGDHHTQVTITAR